MCARGYFSGQLYRKLVLPLTTFLHFYGLEINNIKKRKHTRVPAKNSITYPSTQPGLSEEEGTYPSTSLSLFIQSVVGGWGTVPFPVFTISVESWGSYFHRPSSSILTPLILK